VTEEMDSMTEMVLFWAGMDGKKIKKLKEFQYNEPSEK